MEDGLVGFDGYLAFLVDVARAGQRVRQPVDQVEDREREWKHSTTMAAQARRHGGNG